MCIHVGRGHKPISVCFWNSPFSLGDNNLQGFCIFIAKIKGALYTPICSCGLSAFNLLRSTFQMEVLPLLLFNLSRKRFNFLNFVLWKMSSVPRSRVEDEQPHNHHSASTTVNTQTSRLSFCAFLPLHYQIYEANPRHHTFLTTSIIKRILQKTFMIHLLIHMVYPGTRLESSG